MARTGRPPGATSNREAIRASAAHHFSEYGYDRTSMRSVAVEFPFDPAKILPEVLDGDRSSIGERLARAQLALLDDPDARRRLTSLVRAASSEPDAARMLREFLMREVIGPLAEALGSDEPELRVSFVGSQIIGLMMARYIVEVEPLASLPAERVVEMIGPTLQRYLMHPLPHKH